MRASFQNSIRMLEIRVVVKFNVHENNTYTK